MDQQNNTYTDFIPTRAMASAIDNMINAASFQRKTHERRWYDNNFFDDGYHFRYVSRTTGKIVDVSDKTTLNLPDRAIPKASRQIRGVANLISGVEPTPVVYPEKVARINYPDPREYQQALQISRDIAQKTGHWIEEEWMSQELPEKIIYMLLLAAKHSVSFIEIWPDAVEEKIRSEVFDAFDIHLFGNYTSVSAVPFIIKTMPEQIMKIIANESFDREVALTLLPDNKFASSEIKQAYMQTRFGIGFGESNNTVILKEAFIKEYITKENESDIRALSEKTGAMENRKVGDMIIRHAFTAGGKTLLDEYIDLKDYPFKAMQYEPGPLYQTPLIERFIPANKSLDIIASRLERWSNTMVTGTWLKKKGENFDITNVPGGQVIEYTTTPPVQGTMANVPAGIFNFVDFLNQVIEEQGASTSALGKLPEGVKSGVAIESMKATEYDNLRIPTKMYKKLVKNIAETMLDIADKYFITPQEVQMLEKGEPSYFDVIGRRGMDLAMQTGIALPEGIVPLSSDARVDIEVESGLGFTMAGKKETIQQIINFMTPLIQQGVVTTDVVKVMVEQVLKTFQFGATQDVMDALETGTSTAPLTEDQITQMKVALAQVFKEVGVGGAQGEKDMINTTKMGVAEALQDLSGGTVQQ